MQALKEFEDDYGLKVDGEEGDEESDEDSDEYETGSEDDEEMSDA